MREFSRSDEYFRMILTLKDEHIIYGPLSPSLALVFARIDALRGENEIENWGEHNRPLNFVFVHSGYPGPEQCSPGWVFKESICEPF
jgi:hypothetical protein